MNVRGIFCLVLIVSALVLFAGCTGQQPAVQPSPVTTTTGCSDDVCPHNYRKTCDNSGHRGAGCRPPPAPREQAVESPVLSERSRNWTCNNTSVQAYLADYKLRANDTFTWYDNGTLVYRNPNGTAYTTGTWNLTKNNTRPR